MFETLSLSELADIYYILCQSKERILNPSNWCQYNFALSENYIVVNPISPKAKLFCVLGTLEKQLHIFKKTSLEMDRAGGKEQVLKIERIVRRFLREICINYYNTRATLLNDREPGTHETVLELYDHAILDLRKIINAKEGVDMFKNVENVI